MVCIYCAGETQVINSRPRKRTNSVWRRRQCQACHTVFTSLEEVDLTGSIVVRKRAAVEPFSRDKLLFSVYDSLKHRKTATEDATALVDTILSKLYGSIKHAGIDVVTITETTVVVLTRFDKAAAVHYRAFHPSSSPYEE